ncbi:Shedu anti-phage system protein SduA domain-containing protein [Halotia wernerae UHCC 0503]|nr:Shedu anti-phage system protein SduA domain-containing protein [Halotia wernerae UHCC 0503]
MYTPKTPELRDQIHKYLDQLSVKQLQIVSSFLAHLVQPAVEHLSQPPSFLLPQAETILRECPPDEFKVDRCNITSKQLQKLVFLVSKSSGETEIDKFLKQKKNLPVLAFVSEFFHTGHDGVWILPQQDIRPRVGSIPGLRPDYLFGGYDSIGMNWWVLELKGANEKVCIRDSKGIRFSSVVQQGRSQLDNYIKFCTKNAETLREAYKIRTFNEPKGILIVGREKEFLKNEEKQSLRRDFTKNNPQIQIRTYDSLIRRIMRDAYIQYKLPWLSTLIFSFLTNEPTDDYWYFDS